MEELTERALREDICRIGKLLYERGFIGGVSGNLSARLSDGAYIATPTGSCLGTLTPDALSRISADGTHTSGPAPTTEMRVHIAIYTARPDCKAVVHAHSPAIVAWSCMANLDAADAVPAYTPYGLMRYGRVGLAAYAMPGSADLAHAVACVAPHHAAILLAHHGAMLAGNTLEDAAHHLEELEAACRVALTLRGLPAHILTEKEQNILLRKH